MKRMQTKHAAEAVLRELSCVIGACVHEDVEGRPREVHLLVRAVPSVRDLAQDVRELLEERLQIPIDQRIISIAQISEDDEAQVEPTSPRPWEAPDEEAGPAPEPPAGGAAAERTSTATVSRQSRLVYGGLETHSRDARVTVRVRLSWRGAEFVGEWSEVDAGHGRVRAAAGAMVRAAMAACGDGMRFELEAASVARAMERDYALVSVLAMAPWLGRRPVPLVGAHPVEGDVMTAGALAVLKATNRIIERRLEERDRESA